MTDWENRDFERIEQSMNAIRDAVGSKIKAIIVSKNFVSDPKAKYSLVMSRIPVADLSRAASLFGYKFDDIGLVTVMVPSKIGLKTEEAHKDAPNSEFFKEWLRMRKDKIITTLEAVDKSDWETIAQQAELDTIHLHGVTMSGQSGKKRKIIALEPETIQVMRKINELREREIPVHYSIDTGPTPVLITKNAEILNLPMPFCMTWERSLDTAAQSM